MLLPHAIIQTLSFLFPNCLEQAISDITDTVNHNQSATPLSLNHEQLRINSPRHNHPPANTSQLLIHSTHNNLHPLSTRLLRRPSNTLNATQDRYNKDLLNTPLLQSLDRRFRSSASRDDRINNDGEIGGGRASARREVVVILDRLEGCLLAEEAEMVDGDRGGEDGLEGYVARRLARCLGTM